jgi:hypothetical protein
MVSIHLGAVALVLCPSNVFACVGLCIAFILLVLLLTWSAQCALYELHMTTSDSGPEGADCGASQGEQGHSDSRLVQTWKHMLLLAEAGKLLWWLEGGVCIIAPHLGSLS